MDPSVGDDFAFKFKLDSPDEVPVYQDSFTEMVRCQLEALLDVVILTSGEKNVSIDGFKFINEQNQIYKIFRGKAGAI